MGEKGNDWAVSEGQSQSLRALGSLGIMVGSPLFIMILFQISSSFGQFKEPGSLVEAVTANPSILVPFSESTVWPNPFNPEAWRLILSFMAFELVLMRVVPGARFEATKTSKGHVPVYKANGVACLFITLATFIGLGLAGVIQPEKVYDVFGDGLAALNVFSLVLCFFLLVKGLYFPSTPDNGSNGNLVTDFYWGTELYPRVFGWDVKQFTNCRFGMMYWAVGPVAYAWKQSVDMGGLTDGMLVSVILQLVYVTKFFWWETGYFCSMDIQHDRAGYYICWGCLCWVPSLYTLPSYYLVANPVVLGPVASFAILSLGLLCIWMNYDSDRQRQDFRSDMKNQIETPIWGRAPEYIKATYKTSNGKKTKTNTSYLLASGYWGVSRHFHYIPEILAAFFWTAPAGFGSVVPYIYVLFLIVLLFDRSVRDDVKCASKYGRFWKQYQERVPAKIIPYLF